MKQIVLEQPGEFVERESPEPVAAEGEAIVRIRSIGVCGTDLHAYKGRQPFFSYPRVLGHELGGEIVEAPQGSGLSAGDRCAVEPYLACNACAPCAMGRYNCCESLKVLGVHVDGGMRPMLRMPVNLLHRSEKLSLDQLALVETLGIGAHAVVRSGLKESDEALVIGAGPIGLAVVQFARLTGAHVRVLELQESRRQFLEALGVETLAAPDKQLADVVFDATGSAKSMETAFELVAFGGKLVYVGLVLGRLSFEDPLFHRREITLIASRNSNNEFGRIIRLIEEGKIDTKPWITHRMRLMDVPGDFPKLYDEPNLLKAMIAVE